MKPLASLSHSRKSSWACCSTSALRCLAETPFISSSSWPSPAPGSPGLAIGASLGSWRCCEAKGTFRRNRKRDKSVAEGAGREVRTSLTFRQFPELTKGTETGCSGVTGMGETGPVPEVLPSTQFLRKERSWGKAESQEETSARKGGHIWIWWHTF